MIDMELPRTIDYPITRAEQSRWAAELARPLVEGEVNPLEFITKLKGLQQALSIVEKDKDVRDTVLREIYKHGKQATWSGATIATRETGVRYDYTACGDPVYNDLARQREALDKRLKEREAFLKTVPADGATLVWDETGEIYTLHPPVRLGAESYAITFGKG